MWNKGQIKGVWEKKKEKKKFGKKKANLLRRAEGPLLRVFQLPEDDRQGIKMMLSHPVLLGFVWSLLIHSMNGQPQISNQETNKVYAYSYHFQHNGTTNSKDILRTVLGADPDFEIDPPSGQSIIKTFSSPNIRGFFTKGVLPAGPLTHNLIMGSIQT
ncbi:uncharacterized protein CEXT_497691 [Caerostris extrusa]|uniref:Dirigent protein n=1 Tax=Caerostris extrusa TaxID=172846 RepID=A0AAV4XQP4_CAEEX|nr:uncharacterized protein CEXT_497691 [Caerostris extrusa]